MIILHFIKLKHDDVHVSRKRCEQSPWYVLLSIQTYSFKPFLIILKENLFFTKALHTCTGSP